MNVNRTDQELPLVVIVDDDEKVREALSELMASVGLETACFGSARELLESKLPERPGCMVLDVRLPGVSGLEFQHHLASSGKAKPIVFLTGVGLVALATNHPEEHWWLRGVALLTVYLGYLSGTSKRVLRKAADPVEQDRLSLLRRKAWTMGATTVVIIVLISVKPF